MAFAPGDHVHVALFGPGVVREVRNGGRYLVDVKGNAMVVGEAQLKAADAPKRARSARAPTAREAPGAPAAASIDLHGRTTVEAEAQVDEFLNDAMLAGLPEVRIIHGISGGRVKSAVHARLRRVPSVRGFRVDPANPGVTIVTL
ncbi:MAG: Smr/MutS family protein [Acidobacteriota bacterium]|nr:Smr/MutS family protein [Acidobacteriota bacterium]